MRLGNVKRHGNETRKQQILLEAGDGPRAGINWTHELAIRAWNGHKRVDVSSGLAVSAASIRYFRDGSRNGGRLLYLSFREDFARDTWKFP